MKVLTSWLNEFVELGDFKNDVEGLAQKLTDAGLEVEAIEKRGHIDQLVVGYILDLKKHPHADRLTVCQVDIGSGENRQIICGATNHRKGDKVCVALPGCVLPGDFKIKKSKIRGEVSEGMLCSDKEMNISGESEGIRILPQEAPVGVLVANHLNLKDTVMDIGVTPNRADCLSHWGLAREVSCLIESPLKKDFIEEFKASSQNFSSDLSSTSLNIKLQVENTDLCPRFTGVIIQGLKVAPSPPILVNRLTACGIPSINNIVDMTNYIMLELGQPMHAYDLRDLNGGQISVGLSQEGELFKSFDGSEFHLTGEELSIRSGPHIVGLAGVVGSIHSGIKEDTQDIFLECAYFLPSSVRKTSRRLGIETDAGYRFARGVDIEMLPVALRRACSLLLEFAGGQVVSEFYDIYPQPLKKNKVFISLTDLKERLGFLAESKNFESYLKRLDCKFKVLKEGAYEVEPPSFRYDLTIKEDLVEEYGRLEGYNKIPEVVPQMPGAPVAHDISFLGNRALIESFSEMGFKQCINFHFSNRQIQEQWFSDFKLLQEYQIGHSGQTVEVVNPLSDKLNIMREALFPSLFQNALHNYKYGQSLGKLFEVGSIFYSDSSLKEGCGEGEQLQNTYCEDLRLAGIQWGSNENFWTSNNNKKDLVVLDLKSSLEAVFEKLNLSSYRFDQLEDKDFSPDFLHPGQGAKIFLQGQYIGLIGGLHPRVLENSKIRTPMAYFELNPGLILKSFPSYQKVKSLVYFPVVKRDMTFELSENVPFKDVAQVIKNTSKDLFCNLILKDIYKGERLKSGVHALTVTLFLQDPKKPLEDQTLDKIQKKIFKAMDEKFSL